MGRSTWVEVQPWIQGNLTHRICCPSEILDDIHLIYITGRWFQPKVEEICASQIWSSPQGLGENSKNIWNHHRDIKSEERNPWNHLSSKKTWGNLSCLSHFCYYFGARVWPKNFVILWVFPRRSLAGKHQSVVSSRRSNSQSLYLSLN